jgi:hypothetical protein
MRDLARLEPGRLGQHHRRVRRHVAMARVARRLDRDGPPGQAVRQPPLGHHGVERLDHERADFGEDVHGSGPL